MAERSILKEYRRRFDKELHMPNFYKRSLRPFIEPVSDPGQGGREGLFRARDAREIEARGVHARNVPSGCSREEEKVFFRQFGPIDYVFRPRGGEIVVFF